MNCKQLLIYAFPICFGLCSCSQNEKIDREALLERNNPIVTQFDSLQSLTVGNGGFAFTVDASGLQTFPEEYSNGIPLGTMSDWGWHAFPNTENYRFSETLKAYDFGHGHEEVYSTQLKEPDRAKDACNFIRMNPHRLHLGVLGLYLDGDNSSKRFTDINQKLNLETGMIMSNYKLDNQPVEVQTVCDPNADCIAVSLKGEKPLPIVIRMPYPTGGHSDDACAWINDSTLHKTVIEKCENGHVKIAHIFPEVDVYDEFDNPTKCDFSYSIDFNTTDNNIQVKQTEENTIVIYPSTNTFDFTCEWSPKASNPYTEGCTRHKETNGTVELQDSVRGGDVESIQKSSRDFWHEYWYNGGIVDFSHCKDARAKELERRVVLSQYLLAVNCAGNTPPQETGLTYNSWFGKYHLEMIYWHQAQFALYGHPELLERSLKWYKKAEPVAKAIAERQGFKGVRWMKMTDPTGLEAPSSVGSFLIWQQPHYIYLSELEYRAAKTETDKAEILATHYDLVSKTAEFMMDFATYDSINNRYVLKGNIPAQETLKAAETINSPYELSEWYCTLGIYQQWRERKGEGRDAKCDEILGKFSHLASINDPKWSDKYGELYLAAETAPQTYEDITFTSDHMAVLGALGIYPDSPLCDPKIMSNTLHWVWDNWNWDKTWGWDYPMTAMCAARLGEPDMCINVLLGGQRTNTYLVSGHNYQDKRLRLYLPGNGGLLTAIACMTAGWDGCEENNPGFPKDGNWDVRWEGIKPIY